MQPHQRKALYANALNLPPGRPVTRDTVEAAIWHTVGFGAPEQVVGRLLSVIDAYVAARLRGGISVLGVVNPGLTKEDVSVRAQMNLIAGRSQAARAVPDPQPRAAKRLHHPDIISDEEESRVEEILGIKEQLLQKPIADVKALPTQQQRSFQDILDEWEPDPDDHEPTLGQVLHAKRDALEALSAEDADYINSEAEEGKYSRCNGCKKVLPVDNFWKNTRRASGVDYKCKECKKKEPSYQRSGRKKDQQKKKDREEQAEVTEPGEQAS